MRHLFTTFALLFACTSTSSASSITYRNDTGTTIGICTAKIHQNARKTDRPRQMLKGEVATDAGVQADVIEIVIVDPNQPRHVLFQGMFPAQRDLALSIQWNGKNVNVLPVPPTR